MSGNNYATYRISGAIRDKKGRVTEVQIEDAAIYTSESIIRWIKAGTFSFYTTQPDGTQTPISVRGKRFMVSKGNKIKEDNLDYLPVPALI